MDLDFKTLWEVGDCRFSCREAAALDRQTVAAQKKRQKKDNPSTEKKKNGFCAFGEAKAPYDEKNETSGAGSICCQTQIFLVFFQKEVLER